MSLLFVTLMYDWENHEELFAAQISLLDMKRSMNVNIFLKQFKMTNEAIVELIKHGDDAKVGAEKLKGLLKVMPEKDEVIGDIERHSICARASAKASDPAKIVTIKQTPNKTHPVFPNKAVPH